LQGDWQRSEALTEHAEGHAAAVMRQRGMTDATLYLNKHPCRKPAGCHYNIEKALPRGSRLTVWVVNANGSALKRTYVGTGEAVDA
jgi:hypothetical protein